jgi:hypothetical protein
MAPRPSPGQGQGLTAYAPDALEAERDVLVAMDP